MPVALLDERGRTIATNNAWRRFGRRYGSNLVLARVRANVRGFDKRTAVGNSSKKSSIALDLIPTSKGETFGNHSRYRIRVRRLSDSVPSRFVVMVEVASELARATGAANNLGQRILEIQAQERQRFAAELHDTVGQYFVSLELLLSRLRVESESEPAAAVILEMSVVLKQAQAEIRTLSYLLSPPWVENEGGLEKAISTFVQGFAKRANLKADINIQGSAFRLDQSRQLTLFRIVQEALVNIYRHANADLVAVNLTNRGSKVTVQVIDNGTGFSHGKNVMFAPGAGLMGMRARIKHFGGELHIRTSDAGTRLTATLPVV
jgi:signal transduction histidine kinase